MDTILDHSRRAFLRRTGILGLAGFLASCQQVQPANPDSTSSATEHAATNAPTKLPATTPLPEHFSGALAFTHAATQMQWVPRDTGSEGWRQCGDYIAAQLKVQGWTAEDQFFDYQGTRCRNIIGKRGSGPYMIIGAHYDSRRQADNDSDPNKRTQPVPAANDGASGVAVLLELARVLKPETLGRTIWLAAFDAEDNGGLGGWDWTAGSRFLAGSLSNPPQAAIVLDMIGDADQQIYYERNSDPSIKQAIWSVAADLGYTSFIAQERFAMEDDHTPFLQRGYRAVDLIDFDYPSWHTTTDTLDKISAASLEAVGRTIETWLQRGALGLIETAPTTPAYPAPVSPTAYQRR